MLALDLFNTKYEQDLREGAVDDLEARRIDTLNDRMQDLLARAKEPAYKKNPGALAALKKQFQQVKDERDSYYKVNTNEGAMKRRLENLALRMSKERFVSSAGEYGMSDKEAAEFWHNINGVEEAGIPGNVPVEKIPGKEDLLKGRGRSYYEGTEENDDWYDRNGRPNPRGAYDAGGNYYADREDQDAGYDAYKERNQTSEATGDYKFDSMMGRISKDPWTQLNSDPNWEYEIEELVDQHIEPWLLAMEKSGMPITKDNETLNPGWRKRYEQISTQLAQKYLTSKKFNPRDPDLVGKIRAAIDNHTDQSRNVSGQLSAYADDLPLHRYADAFDADGQTANIRDAMAGLAPRDDDDDGYAPRPAANPRRLDPGNMEEGNFVIANKPESPEEKEKRDADAQARTSNIAQDHARAHKRDILQSYAKLGRMRTEAIWALENDVYMNKDQILDYIEKKSQDPSLSALEYMHDLGHDVDGLFKNVTRFLTGAGISPAKIQAVQNKITRRMGEINERRLAEDAVDSKSWMTQTRAKHPDAKFMQAKMPGAPIRAYVNGKVVAEFNTDQKKNSEPVDEYISMGSDKNFVEAEPYKNYRIYVRKKPFGTTGMYTAHTEIDRKEFMGKGPSQEEAVQAARDRIDFVLNAQRKVTGSSTIDFNVKFATDLLADPKQTFYAKLENINGEPKLVIASSEVAGDPELLAAGDFKRSALRNQPDDQGRATPLPGIPLTAKGLRSGDWIANGRYTVGKETQDRDGNRVFDLTYHSTAHTKSDKLRLNQPAFTLGTAREVDEEKNTGPLDQKLQRLKVQARRQFPRAHTDDEALVLKLLDKETQDDQDNRRTDARQDAELRKNFALDREQDDDIDNLQTQVSVKEHGGGIGPRQHWQDLMPEQYTNDDDWYDDEDEDLRLRSGDYVRDQQDGESGEIFRMQGDPYERRVRILDRNGKGWYIEPGRLTRVDPQDPDVQRYFGKKRVRDMDEAIDEKGALKAAQAAAKFIIRNLDDRAALKDYSMHFWSPAKFYQGATMAMRGVGHDEIVKHITQDQPAQFEAIVASGPSRPLDDRAVRKMVWDTMKINADTGEQAIQRALAVLAKKPQSRMVQDLQDKFQSLADRLAQGVAEGADQVKRVFKDKAGKPVGEIGIDPESSPGNGEWYVHHYATGYSVVGFDSAAEAKRELLYVHKHPDAVEGHPSTKEQGVAESANVNPQFINAQVTKILAGEARRMTNAPMAQLLAPVMKEYSLTLQQIDSMVPGGLKKAAGEYGIMMKEGWSDAMVARRTGTPRTPYSVFIKGRKWKDFESDDHAEAVANKLKAKFKADGRDPETITIAPTDYDQPIKEEKTRLDKTHINLTESKTYKLWESAGRKIVEAQLTAAQIQQIFQQAEQGATAAGTNRTSLGQVKDAGSAVAQAWEQLKTKVANSGPVKNVDAYYDQAAEKLKQATGGDQGVMQYVEKYRTFAKAHPIAQSLIYSALIAAAGISGAGAGGAAALALLKLTDKLLQGEKFSSAAYSGAKTGALAYGASLLKDLMSGTQGVTTSVEDPEWEKLRFQGDLVSVNQVVTTTNGTDTFKEVIQSIVGPNDKGEYLVRIVNNDDLREFVTKTPPPSVASGTTESKKYSKSKLTETQIKRVFQIAGRMQDQLNEGTWDSVKNTAKGLAAKATGAVVNKAQTIGTNLTTKVTADKLMTAWKKAGSPLDSEQVKAIMKQSGVADNIIIATMPAQTTTAPVQRVAAGNPTQPMPATVAEDQDTSGVERAILNRIMVAHTDLLMKFGPDKVMQAAEEVAYNVGDVDEIGTSDVSAYVAQVKQILGAVNETQVNEKWTAKYKSSINCAAPKGFSQKAHCAGRKK